MRKEGKALSSYFQILRKESINGESCFFWGGLQPSVMFYKQLIYKIRNCEIFSSVVWPLVWYQCS